MEISNRKDRVPEIQSMSKSHVRLYATCGVVAPIFFTLMVIIEGFMVTGYNHMTQQMSDLGAYALYGSKALLQNLNFTVFGILIVTFALGLNQQLPSLRSTTVTLALFGIIFFLLGFFPDEPTPWPAAAHYLLAWTSGVLIFLSILFTWRRLRKPIRDEDVGWTGYGRFSLVILVLGIISYVLFGVFGQPGSPVEGLLQRVSFIFLFLWIEAMAIKLLQSSRSRQS